MELAKRNLQKEQIQLITSSISSLWQERKFADVTLVCKDRDFKVHRIILAAQSKYFADAFDSMESTHTTIPLPWIETEALQSLLEYMYCGMLSTVIGNDMEKLKFLLEAAHDLKIDAVITFCCDCLLATLSPSDFTDTITIAEKYVEIQLKRKILIYLSNNFEEVQQSYDYLELNSTNLKLVISLTSSSVNEDIKLKAILKWVKHGTQFRIEHLSSLLSTVDFPKLSNRFVMKVIEEELLLNESNDFLQRMLKTTSNRLRMSMASRFLHIPDVPKPIWTNQYADGFSTGSQNSVVSCQPNDDDDEDSINWSISPLSPKYTPRPDYSYGDNDSISVIGPNDTYRNSLVVRKRHQKLRANLNERALNTTHQVLFDKERQEVLVPLSLIAMAYDFWENFCSFSCSVLRNCLSPTIQKHKCASLRATQN